MKQGLKALLDVLQMGFVLAGFFLGACILLLFGLVVYVGLEEPKRLAVEREAYLKHEDYKVIHPQPLLATLADTNVYMPSIPLGAYLNGIATNAAIWANGNAHQSGSSAAAKLLRDGWVLWLLGLGTLIGGLFLRCCRRRLEGNSELGRVEYGSKSSLTVSKRGVLPGQRR